MPDHSHHPLYGTILNSLRTQHNLPVSPSWLSTFLSTTSQPPPPVVALTSTARFRILVSDIKTSLSCGGDGDGDGDDAIPSLSSLLPININDVNIKQQSLGADVVVQVLDIIDVGTSKWSQVEALERVERGEEVRGREVIRTVAGMGEDSTGGGGGGGAGAGVGVGAQDPGTAASIMSKKSLGPHRLILQDARGTNVTGFEQVDLPQLFISDTAGGMSIGCKLLLRSGTLVRRGMVILTPDTVVVLGGKVESWDSKWRELRKERLVRDVERQNERATSE